MMARGKLGNDDKVRIHTFREQMSRTGLQFTQQRYGAARTKPIERGGMKTNFQKSQDVNLEVM